MTFGCIPTHRRYLMRSIAYPCPGCISELNAAQMRARNISLIVNALKIVVDGGPPVNLNDFSSLKTAA